MLKGVADRDKPFVHLLFVLDSLVCPVGCLAVLSLIIHALGPDLDLDVGPATVLYGDMQGLIAVRLRIGDPVTQPGGILLVFLCNIREHLPAEILLHLGILVAIDDETYGEDIEDSLEWHLLLLHLHPD